MNQDEAPQDDTLKQAAYWFATLQDENHTASDKQAFKQWLASSESHQKAWQRVALFSQSMEELDKTAAKSALTSFSRKTTRPFSRAALLSSLLLIGLTLFAFWQRSPSGHYQTQIGETKQLELADGTQLWLNTNTSVDIVYSEQLRAIQLHHGEVWIRSGKEQNRPHRDLVVDTEDGRLTALGTEFSVHYQADHTTLNVFAGAVQITPSHHTTTKIVVPSGQQSRFNESQILQQALPIDPARFAWTNGVLLAQEQPLCDFVHELNRYRQQPIQCAAELNQYHLVGVYPLQDMPKIITAIEASLPVRIRPDSQGQWRITANKTM